MTLEHHFKPADRGAALYPPNLRIYRSKVCAVKPKDDAGDQEHVQPGWGLFKPEHWWVPLSLSWGTNGRPSILRLKVTLGQGANKSRVRPEDHHCNPGDEIRLVQVGAGLGAKRGLQQEWFRGHIGQEAMLIQAHPDVESVTLTAYGPELLFSHRVITGMWCPKATQAETGMKGTLDASDAVRDNVWEAPLPVILNPSGKGNASDDDWKLTSRSARTDGYAASAANNVCKVFAAPGVTAKNAVSEKWDAYTALRSVVEWLDDYTYISYERTGWKAIEALLGSTPIGQINLTGRNLLEAIAAILIPVGYGFAFEPWRDEHGRHRLIVFALRDPPNLAHLHMAPVRAGNVGITSEAGQRAQVQRVDFTRDNRGVKNHIIVMGDVKLTERELVFHEVAATRDLHPYWNQTTYNLDDYDDASHLIGFSKEGTNWASEAKRLEWSQRYNWDSKSDCDTYRHVFRTFAWNEDGGLSDIINDGGDPRLPTLTHYSPKGDSDYARYHPRPPKPFRNDYADSSSATSGALKPVLVEIGIVDDDDSWVVVPSNLYSISKARCALTFIMKDLTEWFPWKMKEDTVASGSTTVSMNEKYGHLNYPTVLWNTLRDSGDKLEIRLTAAFEMDGCVTYEQPRQLDSSWPFDARALVYMPTRFKYRDVDGSTGGHEAAIDDGAADGAMDLYGQRVRDTLEDATGHGSIVLRGLHRSYAPGQGVIALWDRNIDMTLQGRRQNKAASIAPIVIGINWNFQEGVNKTELILETPTVALPA